MEKTILKISGMSCASCAGIIERNLKKVPGVKGVAVNIVWEPLWSPEKMSDEARAALGI